MALTDHLHQPKIRTSVYQRMATLVLQFNNANREPLDDVVDVDVTAVQTDTTVTRIKDLSGKKKVRVNNLNPGQPYRVRVFPMRHRPVGQFALAPGGEAPENVVLFCPVQPERVQQPVFPAYTALDGVLRTILERSTLEHEPGAVIAPPAVGATPGAILFNGLDKLPKAGLLNLFCKMRHTPLGGLTCWDFVTDAYRLRGDRIFANVTVDFRDRVKSAVAGGTFHAVDQSLHKPGPGFAAAGSFKTQDLYGNLQLTFFSSVDAPLRFQVDADIDDAAGIEHAFQVLGHALTGGETHPYDIHEILTFYQRLNVGYDLPV